MFPCWAKVSAVTLPVLLAAFLFPESSSAQYDQRAELAVGYSRLQFQPDGEQDVSLDGWQAALTGYVRPWIGFTADFSGHYGSLDASGAPLSADLSHFSYLLGPRARVLRTRLVSASILALFGASRGTLDAGAGVFEGTVFSASVKQTKFAAAVGGAVDINLTPRVAWRVEPVYFLTSFGGDRQNNFRFSTGIVYRFGTDWR